MDIPMNRAVPHRAIRPALGWLALLALAVWCVVFAALALRPAAALDEARGLYTQEGGPSPFRWTSSRVLVPLSSRGAPVGVTLGLAAGR